jgi:RNA polymerase sigma-70 factor, ECF subfamily
VESRSSSSELDMRLRSGDALALAVLLERDSERLLRSIRMRLDPRLERRISAEDVLQEVFLAARARIAHYGGDGFHHPYPWLRALALQTLAEVHRHHFGAQLRDPSREAAQRGGGTGVTSRGLANELSGHASSPSVATMRAETMARLTALLEGLGAADREVIALRHFEDLGNDEVAEVLGIAVKAASIRYVRAIRRFKEAVERAGLRLEDLHVH